MCFRRQRKYPRTASSARPRGTLTPTPTPIATARFVDDDGEEAAAVDCVEKMGAAAAVSLEDAGVRVNEEEMETEPGIEVGVCEMEGKPRTSVTV